MKAKRTANIFCVLCMTVMICMMSFSTALAAEQTTTAAPPGNVRWSMIPINTANLTETQLQAYETAKAAYEQTEDEALASLVTAGILTAEEVQNYQTMRVQIGQMNPQGQPLPIDGSNGAPPQGQPMRDGFGIFETLAEKASDEAIQTALEAMTQADSAYREALTEAGIALPEPAMEQP